MISHLIFKLSIKIIIIEIHVTIFFGHPYKIVFFFTWEICRSFRFNPPLICFFQEGFYKVSIFRTIYVKPHMILCPIYLGNYNIFFVWRKCKVGKVVVFVTFWPDENCISSFGVKNSYSRFFRKLSCHRIFYAH